ncbi:MAG TPA: PAS domain S-box protein [Polyangiaceae bacterium]
MPDSAAPVNPWWNDLHELVDQVEDYAMFVLDLRGYVSSWNRGAQKIKLYTPEEIIGKHFSVFYPAEDLARGKPQRELEEALATGHAEDEGWRIRRDGSRFWATVSITLLRDDRGRPKGFAKVTRDLTERRNTQEELRLSEERFRLLVEGVVDYAIYLLDPRGMVATWNTGAEKIKGYSAKEIVGRDFSVFFTPEDRAAGRPQNELGVAAEQGRFEEEGWRMRADGSRFWANVVLTPLRDASGELVGFSKITRDLTARRAAEKTAGELEQQRTARLIAEAAEARARLERERFRSLSSELNVILEGVADGITVQDRSGKLMFANSAAARHCGFSTRDELLGAEPAQVARRFEMLDEHGNAFAPHELPGRRVLAGAQQATALLHSRDRHSGREWWSEVRANAVLGSDGLPEMAISIWHDVTGQRRRQEHERLLKVATETLSASLEAAGTLRELAAVLAPGLCDWCAIHVLDKGVLRCAAVTHADPRKASLLAEYQAQFPPEADDTQGVWQVMRTGVPLLHAHVSEEELRERARDDDERLRSLKSIGMRSVMHAPIRRRHRVVGVLSLSAADSGRRYDERDMTLALELGTRIGAFLENASLYERAQAAAASAAAAAHEAETAGRLKDEFLATVSHELRTPLNAILGWSSLLKAREDSSSIEKGVDVIHRNAKAQSKIIEDILDVSRIITGKLRLELAPVDLATVITDAIEVVRPSAAAKNISVEFRHPEETGLLIGDAERLQQVLWNLLSNAVKFNEAGGRIWIVLGRKDSSITLTVSDNGKGIELDFLPYVFERFKQADGSTTRRFGGLGLGLAIVRHIVELHGGRVAVKSAGPGQGSSFELNLPVRATLPTADAPPERPSRAPSSSGLPAQRDLGGVRVLVIDDERDARELLELVLTRAGARVETAGSAAAGFAALETFRPDIIVSDVGMPDEDGYTLLQRVRSSQAPYAKTPAIALTAYTRREDRARALAMGFNSHLGKPVNPVDLMVEIVVLTRSDPP